MFKVGIGQIRGIKEIERQLDDLQKQRLPLAIVKALTKTAQQVQKAETVEIGRVFDRPTPAVKAGVYVNPARMVAGKYSYMTKGYTVRRGNNTYQMAPQERFGFASRAFTAEVWLKDDMRSSVAVDQWLSPHIFTGNRAFKTFEAALYKIGLLPQDMYCVPGKAADLDQYGNIRAGVIVQILSYLRAFGEQGYRANITDKRRAKLALGTKRQRGYDYIVSTGQGQMKPLAPGIWKRTFFGFGHSVQPIIMFVRKPHYSRRLDFFGVGTRVSRENLGRNMEESLRYELRRR